MSYANNYSDYYERKAFKEGYDDGRSGRYHNPYKSNFGTNYLDLIRVYNEGYADGTRDRWTR